MLYQYKLNNKELSNELNLLAAKELNVELNNFDYLLESISIEVKKVQFLLQEVNLNHNMYSRI